MPGHQILQRPPSGPEQREEQHCHRGIGGDRWHNGVAATCHQTGEDRHLLVRQVGGARGQLHRIQRNGAQTEKSIGHVGKEPRQHAHDASHKSGRCPAEQRLPTDPWSAEEQSECDRHDDADEQQVGPQRDTRHQSEQRPPTFLAAASPTDQRGDRDTHHFEEQQLGRTGVETRRPVHAEQWEHRDRERPNHRVLATAKRDAAEPPGSEDRQRPHKRERDANGIQARPEDRDKGSDEVCVQSPLILPVGIHHHELAVQDVQRADSQGCLVRVERRAQPEDEPHAESQDKCDRQPKRRPQAAPARSRGPAAADQCRAYPAVWRTAVVGTSRSCFTCQRPCISSMPTCPPMLLM